MPLAPPSPNQKVKVFTQEGHAAQRGEDRSMMLPRKKTTPVGVAVVGPRGTKLWPWRLNPVHSKGYDLSTAPTSAL